MIEGACVGALTGAIIGLIEACLLIAGGWALFAVIGCFNVEFDAEGVRHIVHIIAYIVIGIDVLGYGLAGAVADA